MHHLLKLRSPGLAFRKDMKKFSFCRQFVFVTGVLFALHFPLSLQAVGGIEATNVLFNALWEFESDSTFDSGVEMSGGIVRLKRSSADQKRGGSGEVSRFQILPYIWRQYATSEDYENPEIAWQVTEKILSDRRARFRAFTGREPDAFDCYVLWNAPGHYENVRFAREKVRRVVSERAERFSNLVERYTHEFVVRTAKR